MSLTGNDASGNDASGNDASGNDASGNDASGKKRLWPVRGIRIKSASSHFDSD